MIGYVRTHADRFGVEPILAVLTEHGIGIAPSTYYAHAARGFAPTDADLADAYAQTNCTSYGSRTGGCMGGGSCGRPPAARAWALAATRSNDS